MYKTIKYELEHCTWVQVNYVQQVCGVKQLSKMQEEDPTAARKGLYLEIFNFSLGLQRPGENERVGD